VNFKEGPLTKNGPIDFVLKVGQSTEKNPIRFMVKRKRGVASHFWAHKMHVKMLILLVQSQCYGIGRKKLIWGCQRSLLNQKYQQQSPRVGFARKINFIILMKDALMTCHFITMQHVYASCKLKVVSLVIFFHISISFQMTGVFVSG
jgi:hypothetical protein